MSVINTYLNDNAQTPLGRFVVYHSVAGQCLHYCKIDQPILWR